MRLHCDSLSSMSFIFSGRVTDFAYLPYDYEKPAFCGKDDRCIMYPSLNRDYSYFSLCSRRSLEQGLQEHRCLHEAPKHIVGATGPVCGNAIIEDGETCDCGSDEDCPFLDPCCEPGTCQLKSSSQCHTGYCCTEQVNIHSNFDIFLKWSMAIDFMLNRRIVNADSESPHMM